MATLAPWAPEVESREAEATTPPLKPNSALLGVTLGQGESRQKATQLSTKTIKRAKRPVPFPLTPKAFLLTSKLYRDRLSCLEGPYDEVRLPREVAPYGCPYHPESSQHMSQSEELGGAALACKRHPSQLHLIQPAQPRQTWAVPNTGFKGILDPCGALPCSLHLEAYSRGTSTSPQPVRSAPTPATTPHGRRGGR